MWLANQPCHDGYLSVMDKWTLTPAASVACADSSHIERALVAAKAVDVSFANWTSHQRHDALCQLVDQVQAHQKPLIDLLILETGKPVADAHREWERAVDTLRLSAQAALGMHGRWWCTDHTPLGVGCWGLSRRVPLGVCLLIAPFNFPLNLALHKIGPALAVGNPFILKPASATPLTASYLGQLLANCGYPEGVFSIMPCHRDTMDAWLGDPRIRLISFTGSDQVGWAIRQKSTRSEVVLELGGNAACIMDESVDPLEWVPRVAQGAFGLAGQSCISVQHLLVPRHAHDAVTDALIKEASHWVPMAPTLPDTRLSAMIGVPPREQVAARIEQATQQGATVVVGANGDQNRLDATVVVGCPLTAPLATEELFAPVLLVHPYDDFQQALTTVNGFRYGLQTGIVTTHIPRAMLAVQALDVGGVIIGDIPTFRLDALPYGGQKDSGQGREGIESAIQHMTTDKTVVVRSVGAGFVSTPPRPSPKGEGE